MAGPLGPPRRDRGDRRIGAGLFAASAARHFRSRVDVRRRRTGGEPHSRRRATAARPSAANAHRCDRHPHAGGGGRPHRPPARRRTPAATLPGAGARLPRRPPEPGDGAAPGQQTAGGVGPDRGHARQRPAQPERPQPESRRALPHRRLRPGDRTLRPDPARVSGPGPHLAQPRPRAQDRRPARSRDRRLPAQHRTGPKLRRSLVEPCQPEDLPLRAGRRRRHAQAVAAQRPRSRAAQPVRVRLGQGLGRRGRACRILQVLSKRQCPPPRPPSLSRR